MGAAVCAGQNAGALLLQRPGHGAAGGRGVAAAVRLGRGGGLLGADRGHDHLALARGRARRGAHAANSSEALRLLRVHRPADHPPAGGGPVPGAQAGDRWSGPGARGQVGQARAQEAQPTRPASLPRPGPAAGSVQGAAGPRRASARTAQNPLPSGMADGLRVLGRALRPVHRLGGWQGAEGAGQAAGGDAVTSPVVGRDQSDGCAGLDAVSQAARHAALRAPARRAPRPLRRAPARAASRRVPPRLARDQRGRRGDMGHDSLRRGLRPAGRRGPTGPGLGRGGRDDLGLGGPHRRAHARSREPASGPARPPRPHSGPSRGRPRGRHRVPVRGPTVVPHAAAGRGGAGQPGQGGGHGLQLLPRDQAPPGPVQLPHLGRAPGLARSLWRGKPRPARHDAATGPRLALAGVGGL